MVSLLIDMIRERVPSKNNYLQLIRDQLRAVDGMLTNLGGFIQVIPKIKDDALDRVLVTISGGTQKWVTCICKDYAEIYEGNIFPEQETKLYSIRTDIEYELFLIALATTLAKVVAKEQL